MVCKATFERTIFFNEANKFSIIAVKTKNPAVPNAARSTRRGGAEDGFLRFTAVGHDLPRTNAVELELDGEWVEGKYGLQLRVDQWREIVPQTEDGVRGYLASGLVKGIGPALAADIVATFGTDTMEILENHPERLLCIRGITENKLTEIKSSFEESRALHNLMILLTPFKVTAKTAEKIYDALGPTSVEILNTRPFALCKVSGFGFRRVDAILRRNGAEPHEASRIEAALEYVLDDARQRKGHLFLPRAALERSALLLLNDTLPAELRLCAAEVTQTLDAILEEGTLVLVQDIVYLARVFRQEDATARQIARRLTNSPEPVSIGPILEIVKQTLGIQPSDKQEAAVHAVFASGFSIITGSPGTGKTTVLRLILEVYRYLFPERKIALMAPTGRASRRMAESTGFKEAETLHSALGLLSEEDGDRRKEPKTLDADLIIVDECSMIDMWLASKFFANLGAKSKIVLVGDPDQLPSVGAGNVFRELIDCGRIPVTVLDRIFRQASDSLIAYNAKFINEGNTKLYYGNDFLFVPCDTQAQTAETLVAYYCEEVRKNGIEQVQILSPFRSEGDASAEQLNFRIQEQLNPFRSTEEEITIGAKSLRVGDRIMQTKNTDKVSNGDLGFIRAVKDSGSKKLIQLEFSGERIVEYSPEDMMKVDLAYATTIHKSQGSEYDIVLVPLLKAHTIMWYRNLLYTAVTRAKKKVILVGQKPVLFMAIHRAEISKRNTLLGIRVRNYCDAQEQKPRLPAWDWGEDEDFLKKVG